MKILISQEHGKVPVSVVHLNGDLDASSYLDLVNTAQQLYDEGTRHLLIDLTDLAFISSAGLAAFHMLIKMFRGEKTDSKRGLAAIQQGDRESDAGLQKHIKLLNPSTDVDKVLETVGFKQFFEVFRDLDRALQAFRSPTE